LVTSDESVLIGVGVFIHHWMAQKTKPIARPRRLTDERPVPFHQVPIREE
jgi:hypothetical protein